MGGRAPVVSLTARPPGEIELQRYNIGILGATGLVGQRLAHQLKGHPWFRVVAVAASDRSAGELYGRAVSWQLPEEPSAEVAALPVSHCRAESMRDCDLVLSALDAPVAREVEAEMVAAGLAVVSNSSAFRMQPDVPLLIPEINAGHLELVAAQRGSGTPGFMVTNPNCSVAGLALVVAPLDRAFGVRRAVVTTLQAVSGAGLGGPRAIELLDNVVPHIPGEEEKIESELQKILGRCGEGSLLPAEILVSAHCHRVPTLDGHLEAVSLELRRPASPDEVAAVLEGFTAPEEVEGLPSSRRPLIRVRQEADRPQPRLDRDCGEGMSVVVGRIRHCPVLGCKLELLSHNTVRGAAGGALLNAELVAARGLLRRRDRA